MREMIEDAEADVVVPIVAIVPVDIRETTVVRVAAVQLVTASPLCLDPSEALAIRAERSAGLACMIMWQ
ncbi:hypothetical protein FJZ48_04415 [Candidatus Uhrbacteria bacterium]|nr:hypothetical protein [Candidatus Uhrbacteria bacterium]